MPAPVSTMVGRLRNNSSASATTASGEFRPNPPRGSHCRILGALGTCSTAERNQPPTSGTGASGTSPRLVTVRIAHLPARWGRLTYATSRYIVMHVDMEGASHERA